jgi:hypothetical protein
MDRSDGYGASFGTIQGVRIYDQTSSQWMTPDAYAGTTHDPLSQKPFMWNANNPVTYGDPSGYVAAVSTQPEQGAEGTTTTNVQIDVWIQFGGDADTAKNEQIYLDNIKSTWDNKTVTDMNGKSYHSQLNIHVVTDPSNAPKGLLNQINITSNQGARAEPVGLTNRLDIPAGDLLSGKRPAHEFGHILGINDHYCVSAMICGTSGVGRPYSWAKNDIMSDLGDVTGNDFADLLGTHGLGPAFNPGP